VTQTLHTVKDRGIICPKCAFEGKETQLSQPYLTGDGWVQECPDHGKLYIWLHVYATPEGEVFDLLRNSETKKGEKSC